MTSTITARLSARTRLHECLAALFPCGSVTGAPKVRASQILAALEPAPRGLHTGAIGLIRPGGDCTFSVAVRTAVVDARTGRAVYGVGSAITYDSTPAAEYAACRLKAALLAAAPRWRQLAGALSRAGAPCPPGAATAGRACRESKPRR